MQEGDNEGQGVTGAAGEGQAGGLGLHLWGEGLGVRRRQPTWEETREGQAMRPHCGGCSGAWPLLPQHCFIRPWIFLPAASGELLSDFPLWSLCSPCPVA